MRGRAMLLMLVACCAGACGRVNPAPRSAPARHSPPPRVAATPAPARVPDGSLRLLLLGHEWALPLGLYAVVTLDVARPDVATVGAPLTAPMVLLDPDAPFERPSAAAEDFDGTRWARVEPAPAPVGQRLVVRDLTAAGFTQVAAVDAPSAADAHAVRLVRDHAYIAVPRAVLDVDLARPTPALRPLIERDLGPGKSYDFLPVAGDRMLAVDDVVAPRYGDWFSLDARGGATLLGTWYLPEAANLRYVAAALAPGVRAVPSTLHLIADFGGRGGRFQALVAAALDVDGPCDPAPGAPFRCRTHERWRSESTEPPYLLTARGRAIWQRTHRPIAGDHASPWRSVVWHDAARRAVVVAGERGLLVFSDDYDRDTAPTVLLAGELCRDAYSAGDLLVALVCPAGDGAPRASLVVHRWTSRGYEFAARHPLPAHFVDIVDGGGRGGEEGPRPANLEDFAAP